MMFGAVARCSLWFFAVAALFLSVVGGPFVAYAQSVEGAQPVVTDVRIGQHDTRMRIVLDLDKKINFDIFTLPDPYRVVVNLPEVDWRLGAKRLPENKGLLSRMRYGLFAPGTSRMVLDVNGPVDIEKSFVLEPIKGKPWRFVVDLSPTSETQFLETLAAQREKARKSLEALVANVATETDKLPTSQTPNDPQSQAALPPRKPRFSGKHIIALDAGHGGVDPGTVSPSRVYEKNITLAMARVLRQELEATGKYKVVLTRDRDIFLRLSDRVKVAREAGAELFMSIHADSIKNRKTRGMSIYTLSERASDKEAAKLAAKENKADLIAGIDLSTESNEVTNILLDLAQRETMNQSARFAQQLVDEMRHEVKLLRNSHRFAGFAVLKAPDMPSILLELGFLSNRQDERNLLNDSYRRKMAKGIVRGVNRYFAGIQEAHAY